MLSSSVGQLWSLDNVSLELHCMLCIVSQAVILRLEQYSLYFGSLSANVFQNLLRIFLPCSTIVVTILF